MVQHMQIKKLNRPYKLNERQKAYDHLSRQKSCDKIQQPFLIRTLN
jgi:hypothetical protein